MEDPITLWEDAPKIAQGQAPFLAATVLSPLWDGRAPARCLEPREHEDPLSLTWGADEFAQVSLERRSNDEINSDRDHWCSGFLTSCVPWQILPRCAARCCLLRTLSCLPVRYAAGHWAPFCEDFHATTPYQCGWRGAEVWVSVAREARLLLLRSQLLGGTLCA